MDHSITDYLIIALVSAIAIAAHVWLYRWVKFRIDEGVICQFLLDNSGTGPNQPLPLESIAAGANMPLARVGAVCHSSTRISTSDTGDCAWTSTDS